MRAKRVQKYLPGSDHSHSRNAMAAYNYCKKSSSRIEGPLEFGVPPACLNMKGDKAERNRLMIEMGAEKAVEEGHIDIKDYPKVKSAIDLFKNCTHRPEQLDCERKDIGLWIYGEAESGKTRWVIESYPEYYDKDKSKYWNGYINQQVVLVDDLEMDEKFMRGSLKKWVQHKPFPAEDKFGQMRQIRPKLIIVTSNYQP